MELSEKKFIKMTTEPVERLIVKLAVPTIVSMMVTSFYNLADTFFVRQLEQDSMVAAVGIVLPLMSVIQAVGFFCGQGSGNYISRAFGRKDFSDAERMAATGFFSALLLGSIIMAFGLIFRYPLTALLGAKTEATVKSTIDYMCYILAAAPFMCGSIVLNNQLRQQGNAFYAMIGLSGGAIINIVLDPIMIFEKGQAIMDGALNIPFGLGMSVAGAACATAISQFMSFVLLLIAAGKSDNVKIRLRNFTPNLHYFKGISQAGLPSLVRQSMGSFATACLNHAVGMYIGGDALIEAAQAAMTGVNKIMHFLYSALIGFGQGFQPVCGFNYGAKKYERVRKAFYFCIKVGAVGISMIAAAGFVFAESITAVLVGSSPLAAEIACFTFRAQLIVMPLQVWVLLSNMFLQNIGLTGRATFLAMARQGITFVPMVLLLPLITAALGASGLLGIQLAQAASDIVAFEIALPLSLSVLNKLARGEAADYRPATR